MLKQLGIHSGEKSESQSKSHTLYKHELKMNHEKNKNKQKNKMNHELKYTVIKHLEKNWRKSLYLVLSKEFLDFLDQTPKAQSTKEVYKLRFHLNSKL